MKARGSICPWMSGEIALAGLAALVVLAPPALSQCPEPQVVAETRWRSDGATIYEHAEWLAADGLGNVYTLFQRNGKPGLYTSRDGGLSWDGGNFTIAIPFADDFRVAVSLDGILVVTYVASSKLWARTSVDAGLSWDAPIPAANTPAVPMSMVLETSETGLTAVAVSFAETGERSSVVASPDYGRTWGPAVEYSGLMPTVSLDGTTAVVAFKRADEFIVTRRTTDFGQTWEPEVRVNAVAAAQDAPWSVNASGGGYFQLGYYGSIDIRVGVSTDAAASWPGLERVVSTSSPLVPLYFASRPDGRLAVSWLGFVNLSPDHGFTWLSQPAVFSTAGVPVFWPDFALGPRDTFIAGHSDYRHHGTPACPAGSICESVFLNMSCAGTSGWSGPEVRLDTDAPGNGNHSQIPKVVTDAQDRIHAIWGDFGHPDGLIVHHAVLDWVCNLLDGYAGEELQTCGGSVTLDGSGSTACDASGLEYRWSKGGTIICDWSTTPTCLVTPTATTTYTLEVRCVDAPGCVDRDDVVVEVLPAGVPRDLGNVVRAIKAGTDVVLSWSGVAEAQTYTLYRGTTKGLWPTPPFREGLTGTTEPLADVAGPPDLYFYRVAGVNCAGVEGP